MSTYRSIDKFRDPQKLSIANTLGVAVSYLQKNYDTNVMQTQDMINKYINTDLLRDVDKQYLGERIGTLVNFINTSGNRNWTKKSVANEIQQYITTAIDDNVLNAVASTQAYRKQMAEIEAYKKAGKGEYAVQNEWMATQDFQRYMTSGEIGDRYRAGTYIPYKNVSEKILKHADKLKDFGIEYTPYEGSNNGYFRMIGTRETLSPGKVQQYLGAILDASDMQQIQIDGLYSTKDLSFEQVKEQYNSVFDNRNEALTSNINAAKAQLASVNSKDKQILQSRISEWESEKENNDIQKQKSLTKESMAASYHVSKFMDNYTNFLSFDRVKDFKIDDSMFKMYQEQNAITQKNLDRRQAMLMHQDKMLLDQQKMTLDERKLAQDAFLKGAKYDSKTGLTSIDPNNPYYGVEMGITSSSKSETQNKKTIKDPFQQELKNFNGTWSTAEKLVESEFRELINKPGNENLKKMYGRVSSDELLGYVINSPGRYSNLYNILPSNLKRKVDEARMYKKRLDGFNENLDAIIKETDAVAKAMTHEKTKTTSKKGLKEASFDYTIDDKGNLVDGNVLQGNNKNQILARELAALNMAIKDEIRSSGRFSDEVAIVQRAFARKVQDSSLSYEQKSKLMMDMMYDPDENAGIIGDIAHDFAKIGQDINDWFRGRPIQPNSKRNIGRNKIPFSSRLTVDPINNTIGDLGGKSFGLDNSDIYMDRPEEVSGRIKGQIGSVLQKVASTQKNRVSEVVNIDMDNKNSKSTADAVKMALPQGLEYQTTGHIELSNFNPNSGMVDVTIPVKVGKVYEPQTFKVGMTNIPANIMSTVDLNEINPVYNAANKDAIGYSQNYEMPRNASEANQKGMNFSIDQRTGQPVQYPTQTDLIQSLNMTTPPELLKEHEKEIRGILDGDYNVNLIPLNNQWIAHVTKDGENFMDIPTNSQTYDPDKIHLLIPEIMTEAIQTKIQELVGFGITTPSFYK